MEMFLDSESDEEEFEGFPCEPINQSARKRKLVNKALESTEDDDDDDSDDFKGSIKSSGRKRKALEAFESDEDDSGSDEDDASSNDEEEDDDDDTDDGDEDDEEDGIETEDTLEMELNEDDDDVLSNSDQCPICLMSLGGQKLGTPSECQHVFCLACIMEWSKNANTCPVDRKIFHKILVHSTKKGPILERIQVEDRRVPEVGWEQEPTFCEVCNESNREDRMLLCDGCDKGYHLECLRPRLYTVPAGSWYCTTCIEIRRNEEMEEEGGSVPELLPGNVRRSRGTARASARSGRSGEASESDGPQRARTAATNRRRSSSTRGRGRGRGRTASRSSSRGRSRSRTTRRSRTGSSTRRGRGGKKKTRKRTARPSTTTGKPKRKKRKTTGTKKKRRSTTKSKTKKRKVDKDDSYRNPFEGRSTADVGRGLGMSSGLSIFGDHYALNGFEDDSTNEPEQSDSSSSVKSANSDVLGSIFDSIETLHDQNATVSRDGRVRPSESLDKKSPNKESQLKAIESSTNENPGNLSRESSDVVSPPRDLKQRESEKPDNKSRDGAKSISRDNNEGHVTSMKTNESHQSDDRSRDGTSFTTLSRDQTGPNLEASVIRSVKEDKEMTKRNENYQTSLQNVTVASPNKLHEKDSASTEQMEEVTLENRSFKTDSRNNTSATSDHHKKSPGPKLKSEPSSKLPSPALACSSSLVSNSKTWLENSTPSASETRLKSEPSSKLPSPALANSSVSNSKTSLENSTTFASETRLKSEPSSKLPFPALANSSSSSSISNYKRSLESSTPSASEARLKSEPSSKRPSPALAYSSSSSVSNYKRSLENSTPSASETRLKSEPSSKRPSPALAYSSSSWVSNSRRSPKKPTPSTPETQVRFKIPKKNSPSPGTLHSKSHSPQESKVSRSTGIPDGSESKTPVSNRKNSPRYKRVSPIVWTDRDTERNKLPEFKVEDNVCKTKSSTCPKARLPKTPPSLPANKEINSLEDRKISLSSDSKNDFNSSARNFEEKHKSRSKLDEAKKDLGNVHKDYSHRSAFSPVTKTKDGEKSLTISDAKQEDMKIIPTTEITGETSLLGNQNPNFCSKLPLQQLPSSLRSSSPMSKNLGTRPSSSGLTGSTSTSSPGKAEKRKSHSPLSEILGPRPSTGKTDSSSNSLSGKTEKQSSPGQDARVIKFSRDKGELKIKVLPSQEETKSALRSLPEETHPALRSLPEETHPALRSLPPPSSVDPPLPPLNTVQPLSSLKPLKPVARQPPRPKLKMLSTSETSKPGTLTSGIQSSREYPNRTNQNLAIIQMLRHKTSNLRSEVEKEHSLLREELRRETPESEPDSLSRSSSNSCSTAQPPPEASLNQHEVNFNRPKLSSLFGSPRNSNLPVAVVRPSLSSAAPANKNFNSDPYIYQSVPFAGFVDPGANGPSSVESEREKNRRKGIARLQRIERIKSDVKASLQTYYDHNEITRQDFKEIFTRAVDKVKDSNHEVDRHRIASLVKKYVKMFKGRRLIGTNQESDL